MTGKRRVALRPFRVTVPWRGATYVIEYDRGTDRFRIEGCDKTFYSRAAAQEFIYAGRLSERPH